MRNVMVFGITMVLALAGAGWSVRADQSTAQSVQSSPASAASPQVNLNTASAAELEKLPGVGPAMAARILEYRQKNGAFKKTEDILETSRSGRYLLKISRLTACRSVSQDR